jgi:EAL domain-containing protein (putative c-di-GMP-specific phosphodiesterase class I)
VDARDGHIAASKSLARWQHPELGNVTPAEFVPLAESSGQILLLGEWVLRRACQDAAHWLRLSDSPPRVAVNVSATQLRERGFDQIVASALQDAGLPAYMLELEITETALIENIDQAIGIMQRLREPACASSIDDFGTGLASLSYLKRLPVDQLKIDISFIRDVLHDPSDTQIVKAIINLGHSLDLEVGRRGRGAAGAARFPGRQRLRPAAGLPVHAPRTRLRVSQLLHGSAAPRRSRRGPHCGAASRM